MISSTKVHILPSSTITLPWQNSRPVYVNSCKWHFFNLLLRKHKRQSLWEFRGTRVLKKISSCYRQLHYNWSSPANHHMDEELTCCAIQPKDNNHSSERDEKKKSQYLLLIAAVEKGDYGEYQRVTNTSVGKITSTEAFISPKYRGKTRTENICSSSFYINALHTALKRSRLHLNFSLLQPSSVADL